MDEDGNEDIVIEEPYLWSLLKGRRVLKEEAKGIRLESSHGRGGFKTTSNEDSPA